jgi:serine/threonine protein kinase/tetratricopeptide (TPR) repeat protein
LAKTLGELGDYELLEEVGRGGQGVVFRARQKSLNRTVALKVIGLGQWASKAHLKRFRLEAEAAARLEHPGIVPIHEVGERDGSCYFSMKFVEGGQLDEVVRRTPMSIRQAAELIAKVARTVYYAHEHGILHRDIKPGNILLDAKGEPNLTDFGLARLLESESTVTRTMEVLGTPSYMAPEQAVGNNAAVSSATDVYGLGAVLYQLLTGHPPFAGGTTYETIKLVLDAEPRQPRLWNPKIDRDLSTICLKCLEKDPKRRYSSALALAQDLERWLKHEPILARHTGIITRSRKWVRRNPASALLAASLFGLAAAAGWIVWKSEFIRHPVATTGVAVLPFENLSEEKEHTAFVDGVQDDILTKLAKIADLKVISRTSVMDYRGKRNLRQIGNDLRVSHVLEGSVRRTGTHLRLNAQLIDTRTDTHVWAEQYDRDLNELFAVQSEVAQKVAQRLDAKITPSEKVAIERRPTGDLVAFDLYSRANDIIFGSIGGSPASSNAGRTPSSGKIADLARAIDLLNGAVGRDPSFLEAYCQLAFAHDALYWWEFDPTPARLAMAEAAVQQAIRIRPNAGEAHHARGIHLYRGYRDFDSALAELELARQSLPNAPPIFAMMGFIQRRQGRWEESTRNLERAYALDPRDIGIVIEMAWNYAMLRQFPAALKLYDRTLDITPNDPRVMASKASIYQAQGNLQEASRLLSAIDEQSPSEDTFQIKITQLRLERNYREAVRLLQARQAQFHFGSEYDKVRDQLVLAFMQRLAGDAAGAKVTAEKARNILEQLYKNQSDNTDSVLSGGEFTFAAPLSRAYAAMGERDSALKLAERATMLLPSAKDRVTGPQYEENLALIQTLFGENSRAIATLTQLLQTPCGLGEGAMPITPALLRLDPLWDPLRADPAFQKLCEEKQL